MQVKDIQPMFERSKEIFENIAEIEKFLRMDKEEAKSITKKLNLSIDIETVIREVRMVYYDKEVLYLQNKINNAYILDESQISKLNL